METIERYLRTVRMLLPADQRDDIVRELSEETESQVADKEAALGRALIPRTNRRPFSGSTVTRS